MSINNTSRDHKKFRIIILCLRHAIKLHVIELYCMTKSDFWFSTAWLRTRNHNVREPDLPAKSYSCMGTLPCTKYLLAPVHKGNPYINTRPCNTCRVRYLRLDVKHRQMRARPTISIQTLPVHNYLRQKISMSIVLKPILKLLGRCVVCAPLKGPEINIY
jgi:hypothetical protein